MHSLNGNHGLGRVLVYFFHLESFTSSGLTQYCFRVLVRVVEIVLLILLVTVQSYSSSPMSSNGFSQSQASVVRAILKKLLLAESHLESFLKYSRISHEVVSRVVRANVEVESLDLLRLSPVGFHSYLQF